MIFQNRGYLLKWKPESDYNKAFQNRSAFQLRLLLDHVIFNPSFSFRVSLSSHVFLFHIVKMRSRSKRNPVNHSLQNQLSFLSLLLVLKSASFMHLFSFFSWFDGPFVKLLSFIDLRETYFLGVIIFSCSYTSFSLLFVKTMTSLF